MGEIFCLLGTNGAGKTSTFNTMTSQIVANKGDVRIWNIDVVNHYNKARRLIGNSIYNIYYRLLPTKNMSI